MVDRYDGPFDPWGQGGPDGRLRDEDGRYHDLDPRFLPGVDFVEYDERGDLRDVTTRELVHRDMAESAFSRSTQGGAEHFRGRKSTADELEEVYLMLVRLPQDSPHFNALIEGLVDLEDEIRDESDDEVDDDLIPESVYKLLDRYPDGSPELEKLYDRLALIEASKLSVRNGLDMPNNPQTTPDETVPEVEEPVEEAPQLEADMLDRWLAQGMITETVAEQMRTQIRE